MQVKSRVVVVGAVNMDIGGRPNGPLVGRDSNPGRVRMSLGGVGRNIAHNMRLLGLNVGMVTAFGDDLYARTILSSCRTLGIDVSRSLRVPHGATSTYLFITGPEGDMELAVNDMEIYDCLTPDFLEEQRAYLNESRLVVADANLPPETLRWLGGHCEAPLFADPVSTLKAEKLRPILGRLHTLKPNRMEAEFLSGVAITDDNTLEQAAQALLNTGLKRVFISLGGEGVYAAQGADRARLPCRKANMVNTTGCGDAFMAALAWAYLEGLNLPRAAAAGLAASAIAMEGAETINPELNAERLKAKSEE